MRADGAVEVAGDSLAGRYGQVSSAAAELADAGLAPGDALTLSCAGAVTGVTVNVKFFGEDGVMAGKNLSVGTAGYAVPDGAARMTCNVIEDGKGASGVDALLWPMLERGSTAHPFEPYGLGGGVVRDALTGAPFEVRSCKASWVGGRIAYSGSNGWAGSAALFSGELPPGRWLMVLGGCYRFISDLRFDQWSENKTYASYGMPYFMDGARQEELVVVAPAPFRVGVVFPAGDGTCLPQMVRAGDA